MQKTKIEWADYVWNPITGCTKGCEYCYAKKIAYRLKGRYGYPTDNPFKPTFHETELSAPSAIKKSSRIFVGSMGDVFGPDIPDELISKIIDIAMKNPQHTFLFLTKNPDRYYEFWFSKNCWLGYSTTGELWHKWENLFGNNKKFVSHEPMHKPLKIRRRGYEKTTNFDWLIVGAETGNRKNKVKFNTEWLADIYNFVDNKGIPVFIKNNVGPGRQKIP